MLFLSEPSHLFFCIILMIGLITACTDLCQKKIYNIHLILGTGLGLIAVCYALLIDPKIIISHLANGSLAFLIGWLLYHLDVWRGGDAKLFVLFAFLMPPPAYNNLPFPGVMSLFACSFIAGMIILIPIFIKDILINRTAITNDLLLPANRQALFKGIARIIGSSWAFFPFYYLARATNPAIILMISYIFFNWGYNVKKEAPKHYIIEFLKKDFIELFICFVFGLLMRLWLSPNSLSFLALTRFVLMITLSVTLSTCLHTVLNHLKEYRDRVPFAPLLFTGCVLSYTPFLTGLMQMVTRWNVLIYR